MLQHGLTNPQIAERLGITLDGAKYHVAEIMGKLGVSRREDAAAIAIAQYRPWWMAALAPIAPLWRRVRIDASTLSAAGAVAVGAAALAGLGVVAFLLLQNGGGDGSSSAQAPTATEAAAAPSVDSADAATFARAIDGALESGDQQSLIDNAVYQDIVCGEVLGPPGYPRSCQGLPVGASSPGMPVSVLQSEGTYYDPAQYAEVLGPSIDQPRVRALAVRATPIWDEFDRYDEVHEAIVAGVNPGEFPGDIVTFTIGRDDAGWHIIGLTRGSPLEFLDYDTLQPGEDWADFFASWERWEGA